MSLSSIVEHDVLDILSRYPSEDMTPVELDTAQTNFKQVGMIFSIPRNEIREVQKKIAKAARGYPVAYITDMTDESVRNHFSTTVGRNHTEYPIREE